MHGRRLTTPPCARLPESCVQTSALGARPALRAGAGETTPSLTF
uniref:Uncharacterized protein n=1 Tax=uncultured bacterium A1Q1_fos_517 TaxID=1256582 RepID=L7VZH2_9BACT|nr:hypothetical protein [uncultured bacterium A1Q1_fos_517]